MREHSKGVAVAVVLAAVLSGACAGGRQVARSLGDDALRAGVTSSDEVIRAVPVAARPTLGARLSSGVDELTDDPDIQAALDAVAWKVLCAAVTGNLPADRPALARFAVDLAETFGVALLPEGASDLVGAVLDARDADPDQAQQACEQVSDLGP